MTGTSRREFFGTAAAAAAGMAIAQGSVTLDGQAPPTAAAAADETLVLINGRIHTLDGRNTIARVVSIRNGRFVTVGDAAPPNAPGTRVVDLGGRTVVPGVIEGARPHREPRQPAGLPHDSREHDVDPRDSGSARGAPAQRCPAGQWITSMGGWHPNQWAEQRRPTLKELDAAVSDRPVLLYERFTGPCVTNTLGKAFFDAADAAPKVHPDIVPVKVADMAPSRRRVSRAADLRQARCSTCAGCRPSTTRSGARSMR